LLKLLMIDNYDSFTFNLVQMFMRYDLQIHVHRCDRVSLDDISLLKPDYIVISPGPGTPLHSGISIPMIKSFYRKVPILGVCLGMQCINEAFGGRTVKAPVPIHGKTCAIRHMNNGLFLGLPSPFIAARYHSLMIELNNSDSLIKTAETSDRVTMGISHQSLPIHGIQFHPESFMTEHGFLIVENFLKMGSLQITVKLQVPE
jgi:anthranilate synthase component II